MVDNRIVKDPSSVTITNTNFPWRKRSVPLKGITIMLNPGHGCVKTDPKSGREYIDPGATYKLGKNTIFEKDLNDKVATDVKRKLELLGAKVIYVDDTKVKDVLKLENEYKPDMFISIHHDANNDKKISGETIYAHGEKSLALGKEINNFLAADKTIKNRPTTESIQEWSSTRTVLTADPYIPAVLTEIGYMSNKKELKTLVTHEYQDKAAQSIVEGIKSYVRKTRKTPPPKTPAWDLIHQPKKPQIDMLKFVAPEKDM